jgi:hypothetical protein
MYTRKTVLYTFNKQAIFMSTAIEKQKTMTVGASCEMINTEDLSYELSRVIFTLKLIQRWTKLDRIL